MVVVVVGGGSCGSMTHTAKDCTERPRKLGAKFTGARIAADERVQSFALNYDAKRDRWNGYDARDYRHVVERFEKIERKKEEILKGEALMELERRATGEGEGGEGGGAGDGGGGAAPGGGGGGDKDKLGDDELTGFGVVNKRVRTTGGGSTGSVRNLRIREDTAKYLLNLDVNSAHYDPKTRAMREDPLPNKPDAAYHGDNFQRSSGDTNHFRALNLHSVHASERGQDIHMQGAPSQAEQLYREFRNRKEKLEEKISGRILDRYGDASANASAAAEGGSAMLEREREMLLGQTEAYVEYDRAGRVVRGTEAPAAASRWEEDVLVNNHTSVWGSFWADGAWGYACCRQMVKNSWCTGAAGRRAEQQAEGAMLANERRALQAAAEASGRAGAAAGAAAAAPRPPPPPPPAWGAEPPALAAAAELDGEKLREAVRRAAEAEREVVELDERKRAFNSMRAGDTGVTPEEMEAYRMKRSRGAGEDPMASAPASGGGAGGDTAGYEYV